MLDAVAILRKLVSIPSVNPMGRMRVAEDDGGIYYEHRVTEFLAGQFAELGLPCERHEVHPGRGNVLARLEGAADGPTLMLEVHQDTVPIEGMTVEPFTGELRDGRVYGRGACDVKGAMACILTTISKLAAERPAGMPNIVVACTVNEEHGFTGAQHLAELWRSGKSKLLPRAPDAIIVSEPTELNVVVAHKGVVRWRCTARGRAAHSSAPENGDNAIYRMAEVINILRTYASDIVPSLGEHPLLGRPTLSIGTVTGGISVNTVPDHCTIEIDRRLLPDEDPEAAMQHATDYLAANLGDANHHIDHSQPIIVARGLKGNQNSQLADRLIAMADHCNVTSRTIGVPFGTDASAFGTEVPTIVFGPGSIVQAHTKDEWIAVEQLEKATEVLSALCGSL